MSPWRFHCIFILYWNKFFLKQPIRAETARGFCSWKPRGVHSSTGFKCLCFFSDFILSTGNVCHNACCGTLSETCNAFVRALRVLGYCAKPPTMCWTEAARVMGLAGPVWATDANSMHRFNDRYLHPTYLQPHCHSWLHHRSQKTVN